MIRFIAALDNQHGIANTKGIPWDLPSDKAYFREKTLNCKVLMGYVTYNEMAEPLPDRKNIVATNKNEDLRAGFEKATSAREFLTNSTEDIWVIGGAGLFASVIDLADELYLTRIDKDFNCTKFFPEFEDDFDLISFTDPRTENNTAFSFQIWNRKLV